MTCQDTFVPLQVFILNYSNVFSLEHIICHVLYVQVYKMRMESVHSDYTGSSTLHPFRITEWPDRRCSTIVCMTRNYIHNTQAMGGLVIQTGPARRHTRWTYSFTHSHL